MTLPIFTYYFYYPWWFLPESIISMMVTKWWFFNFIISHLWFTFYYKKKCFSSSFVMHLFILVLILMDSHFSVSYKLLLFICFDVQIVPDLVSRSPINLSSVSFGYVPIILWAHPYIIAQQDAPALESANSPRNSSSF